MNITERALQHLSCKLFSAYELEQLLCAEFKNKENYEQEIKKVLEELKIQQVINDFRLAQNLATASIHKGNSFIDSLLQQRFINKVIIKEVIASLPAESKRALHEAKERLYSLADLPRHERKSIVIRFLKGRQFSLASIHSVQARLDSTIHVMQHQNEMSYEVAS